jgi:hypothetical protein
MKLYAINILSCIKPSSSVLFQRYLYVDSGLYALILLLIAKMTPIIPIRLRNDGFQTPVIRLMVISRVEISSDGFSASLSRKCPCEEDLISMSTKLVCNLEGAESLHI